MPIPRPLAERFLDKIPNRPPHECWVWTGFITDNGYGRFTTTNNKSEYAHRVSYTLVNGEIPPGLTIDHLCRNRACVNPSHLEAVSIQTNISRSSRSTATTCVRGHFFDDENTYIGPDGKRACRICHRRRMADMAARKKAKSPPAPRGPRARPTHCVRGHELSDENTKVRANGTRLCLECARMRDKARKRQPGPGRPPAVTHCVHGHPYDDENTYIDPKGRRQCKTCRRLGQFDLRERRWRTLEAVQRTRAEFNKEAPPP